MKKLLIPLLMFFAFNAWAKPVNINSADAATISESLKGIGMKKAEAIVKYRQDKGPFKTVDELDNVKGIGKKTVEKLRKDILLEDAPAPAAESAQPEAAKPAEAKPVEAKPAEPSKPTEPKAKN